MGNSIFKDLCPFNSLFINTNYYSKGAEPNFEDLDLVVDQAVDEKVDIDQADPHSNTIHVAHNNPKNR